jgi:hypothetical protein
LIIIGTIVASIGAIIWLKSKDNRLRLKETLKPKKDFGEMIKQVFDFRWQRVSIIWTVCAFGGMAIVHLGAVMMKNMGAYHCAVKAIREDKELTKRIGEIEGFTYMVTGHATTGNGYSELNFGVIGTKESIDVKAIIKGHSGSYIPNKIVVKE